MRLKTYVNYLNPTSAQGTQSNRAFPVLCLHGHPGSGAAMDVFTNALCQPPFKFTTYAPDLRGYGQSRTAYPFEMTRHLDDLEELLEQYKIEECLVLGWSLGGILAMELALRQPKRVKGLILVGTAARPRGSHPPITLTDNVLTGVAGFINWVFPAQRWAIALGKKSLFRFLLQQHTPIAYRYLARQGAPAFLRTSRHAEAALIKAIRAGYNRLPDIKQLEMPALMLCGECDRHITAEASLETARALPNCEAHCYPHTAHLFPWEIPERMSADICQWLSKHNKIWQL